MFGETTISYVKIGNHPWLHGDLSHGIEYVKNHLKRIQVFGEMSHHILGYVALELREKHDNNKKYNHSNSSEYVRKIFPNAGTNLDS